MTSRLLLLLLFFVQNKLIIDIWVIEVLTQQPLIPSNRSRHVILIDYVGMSGCWVSTSTGNHNEILVLNEDSCEAYDLKLK